MIIKTNLKTGIKKEIEINLNDELKNKLKEFKDIWKENGYIDSKDKFMSNIVSETFASLYTEGEISSRRLVRNSESTNSDSVDVQKIVNFRDAFVYTKKNKIISKSNIFTLYSLLTNNIDMGDSSLKDGTMFRDDEVFIGSNSMHGSFKGMEHTLLPQAFDELIEFIKNREIDLAIRSIVGHLYFEIMHPFFDFNGRTGRFLPDWISTIEGTENMRYFATSVGNFREEYLASFAKSIDIRTKEVNANKFLSRILDLLIINQYQYKHIRKYDEMFINKISKTLNAHQKNIIFYLMIKYERQSNASGWSKLTQDAIDFIEMDLKQSQLSREISHLIDAGIIEKTNTKPAKYKLNGYKLYKKHI